MLSPLVKATLAASALSATSNVLAQVLQAWRTQTPLDFDISAFFRFITLTLITAPPNYKWQQFLERRFPAHAPSASTIRDVEMQQDSGGKEKEEGPVRTGSSTNTLSAGSGGSTVAKLNIRNTATKWFIDCITVGALVNTVMFFILNGFLKGQTATQIGYNVRHETIPLIVAGYKLWPFVSIISFSCVPVEKRIVFLNFIGLLWGIYMSLVAARV